MRYEKPPFLPTKSVILKCFGIVLFLALSVFLLYKSVERGDHYLEVRNSALEIVATVVSVDEDYDPDNGTDYDTVIGYTYEGQYYEREYKTYSTYKKAAEHLGEQVTIYVDPDEPGDTIGSISSSCGNYAIFGVLALIISVAILCSPFRMRYVDAYGWNRTTVQMDLALVLRHNHRWLSCVIPSLVGMFLLSRFTDFASNFLWVCNWVLMFIGLVIYRSYRRKLQLVKNNSYTINKDTLVSKKESYDSDSGTTYSLTFANEKQKWDKTVTKKVYQAMEKGHTIDTVYLQGAKKPILVYSRNSGI